MLHTIQDCLDLLITAKISSTNTYDDYLENDYMYHRIYKDLSKQLKSLAQNISNHKLTFDQALNSEQFKKAKYHSFILKHGPQIIHNN